MLANVWRSLTGPKIERGEHSDEDEGADEAHAEAREQIEQQGAALEDEMEEENVALRLPPSAGAARVLHLHRLLLRWHHCLLAATAHAA